MMEEIYKFKNREEYIDSLDSVMPENYIKKRNLPNGGQKYLPIAIKESIADMMFQEWNVIDEKFDILVNEIVCTVKIMYIPSYPGAVEQFCTGSAAKPIQMDAGAKIIDFPAKKKTNALEYNLPSAKKSAIGDALELLGNLFGRNIGRKLDQKIELPSNFTLRKKKKEDESN